MTVALPEIGKISPEVSAHHILPFLGAKNAALRVGPQSGVDVDVVAIGGGPVMAQAGDGVIVTNGATIEATGLFGVTFPDLVAARCGDAVASRAADFFWRMNVVDDAPTAVSVGVRDDDGTVMHDATECGVWGGLVEIAAAANGGMHVNEAAVPVNPAARAVCEAFGMDLSIAISEGTLLLTCRPYKVDAVVAALVGKGTAAGVVGETLPAGRGVTVTGSNGTDRPLVHPRVDPFGVAFGRAAAESAEASKGM